MEMTIKNDPDKYVTVGMAQDMRRAEMLARQVVGDVEIMPRGGVAHDWWKEYQLLRRQFRKLEKAAREVLKEVDANLEAKSPPFKYGAPFGALTKLRESLPETYDEFKARNREQS